MSADVNVPLLRKAVEWAEAESMKPLELRQWNQRDVFVPAAEVQMDLGRDADCGSCYCIAGYVASVVSGCEDPYERTDDGPLLGSGVMPFAADQLGIEDSEASLGLFAPDSSIADVRRIAEEIAGERL